MGKEILMFCNRKKYFHRHKSRIFKKDVNIGKVLLFKKISSGEKNCKYFIGYLYNYFRVKPLHIILPKTSAFVKSYDGETK